MSTSSKQSSSPPPRVNFDRKLSYFADRRPSRVPQGRGKTEESKGERREERGESRVERREGRRRRGMRRGIFE